MLDGGKVKAVGTALGVIEARAAGDVVHAAGGDVVVAEDGGAGEAPAGIGDGLGPVQAVFDRLVDQVGGVAGKGSEALDLAGRWSDGNQFLRAQIAVP